MCVSKGVCDPWKKQNNKKQPWLLKVLNKNVTYTDNQDICFLKTDIINLIRNF